MRPTVLVACDSSDQAPIAFGRVVAPLLGARVALVNVRAGDDLAGGEADDGGPLVTGARVEMAASAAAGLQRLIMSERPVLTVLGSSHEASHGRVRGERLIEQIVRRLQAKTLDRAFQPHDQGFGSRRGVCRRLGNGDPWLTGFG